MQAPASGSLAYRPDIQILRAVAVLLVILFHLNVRGFSSGFLGVDVFFVISGYLMQRLYGQCTPASEFYLRRARRLFPAYFGTIAATLLLSAFVTLPGEFSQVAEQSMFASVLSSNIGFWLQTSYFENSYFRPLLHLWSLGVEAQFYLIFPLLTRLRRRWFFVVLAGSLIACWSAIEVSPKLPFFMAPFRVWEFGLGMLAANCPYQGNRQFGVLALSGLVALAFVPLNGQSLSIVSGHPGVIALAITSLTATTLVLKLPEGLEASLPGKVAQWIGDVSYSLYLAHFPVIVLMNYHPFAGTILGGGLLTLLVIAAATLSLYFGLERNGPKLFSYRRTLGAVFAICALALAGPRLQMMAFPQREQRIFAGLNDRSTYRCGKLFRIFHPRERFCPIAEGEPILLVGDSHADAIKESFAGVAHHYGWGTLLSVDNDPLERRDLSARWLRYEADTRHARWVFLHFANENLSWKMLADSEAALGSRLVLIEPTPSFPRSVPLMLYRRHAAAPLPVPSGVDAYIAAHPELTVIRTLPSLCDTVCALQDSRGHPYYFDSAHLTLTGARALKPAFDHFFRTHAPKQLDRQIR